MPRVKSKKVIFTFAAATQAIRMERCCRAQDLPGRMIPVPRQISAGCGLAWAAPADAREALTKLAQQEKIEAEQITELYL